MSNQRQQIVITGGGWVTPFAAGTVADVLTALGARFAPGTDRTQTVAAPSAAGFYAVPDATLQSYPNTSKEIRQDKGAWVTAVAVEHALRDSGLERSKIAPERLGMVLGCALAGQTGMIQFAGEVRGQSARFVSPINFPQTVGNFIAGAIARAYDVRGPNMTLAAGTASSLDAVCEASAILRSNRADVMLAGGTDVFTDTLAAAIDSFDTAGGMAKRSAAMSCADTYLAEGACWFILERADDAAKRGARVYATIRSWTHHRGGLQQRVTETCHPAQQPPVVSTAGLRLPAADCIQDWIGFCPGAAGASALAAALASPLIKGGTRGVSTAARILAGDDTAHLTSLDVDLPRTG